MSETKPCPFCGSNDLEAREGNSYVPASVVCQNDDCGGTVDAPGLAEAIAAWNRRAAPEPAQGDRKRTDRNRADRWIEDNLTNEALGTVVIDSLAAEFARVREEQKEMDAKIADGMIDRNDAGKIDHDDIGSITALDIRDAIRRGEP